MFQGRKTGEPATGSDPRLIDARGERRLARVVRSNRRATGAQTDERVNAGSDRKESEHSEDHPCLCCTNAQMYVALNKSVC